MPKPTRSRSAKPDHDPDPAGAAAAGAEAQTFNVWLDRRLRDMFDAVASEPVPQALADLLKTEDPRDA